MPRGVAAHWGLGGQVCGGGGGVSNLGGGIILDWGLRAGVNLSVAMPSKLFLDL